MDFDTSVHRQIEFLEEEIEKINKRIKPLEDERNQMVRKVEALKNYILVGQKDSGQEPILSTEMTWGKKSKLICETAYQILLERKEGVHYKELLKLIEARGISVPGKRPDGNLVSYLFRSGKFESKGKGIWTLKNLNLSKGRE